MSLTYLTFSKSRVSLPYTESVFHKVSDISKGEYYVDWNKITPLDGDIISRMYACEVVVLKMMDRHTISIEPALTYDDRKRLYLKHLRYWNHVLEKNKFDLFLSSNIPHEVYDYVIYCLCKIKGIPTLMLYQTCISDTITVMNDWLTHNISIKNEYTRLMKKYSVSNNSQIHLEPRFLYDLRKNTASKPNLRFEMKRSNDTPSFLKSVLPLFLKIKGKRIITLLKSPSLIYQGFINQITYRSMINKHKVVSQFYYRHMVKPNLNKKYIYFPLHLQPEASTSPMAGDFVNQVLIAQLIAYVLPKQMYLYIKENPYQDFTKRDVEFYRELLAIPQVKLISIKYDTYKLIDNSVAVATATGTVGLEALYRGIPVLLFGSNFYQYANGVYKVTNKNECSEAINNIVKRSSKPSIKNMRIFLKALERTTIEGYIDLDYKKDTNITDKVNNMNITRQLITEINRVILK
ncbi:hypothetical protein A2585_00625 [Candidatus Nomurabacteria bacterium RIFOXYD1_FULL_39_12]|nr:MAG: hypothetical protein A2585_00625 [Candidatus Nomurabacteria bacterium RIFOXYD1_FULL_39_12]